MNYERKINVVIQLLGSAI